MTLSREARFAKHITDLAAAFHVRLLISQHVDHCGASRDDAGRNRVLIMPVTCEVTYAIALHELGHCCSALGMVTNTEASPRYRMLRRYATKRDVKLQLLEEQAAWEWARHYALEWTDVMASVERMAYDTYKSNARMYGVQEK